GLRERAPAGGRGRGALQALQGHLPPPLLHHLARARQDPIEHAHRVAHPARTSRARSITRSALPSSRADAARAAPAPSPSARPATTSDAAALSITTSRQGPGCPPS